MQPRQAINLKNAESEPPYALFHEERRCLHQTPGLVSVINQPKVAETRPGTLPVIQFQTACPCPNLDARRNWMRGCCNGRLSKNSLVFPAGLSVSPRTLVRLWPSGFLSAQTALKSLTRVFKYTLPRKALFQGWQSTGAILWGFFYVARFLIMKWKTFS